MKNSNFKKYRLVIILIVVLIPIIIFNKSIFYFLNNLFEGRGQILSFVKSDKNTDVIEEKESIIKIKPETPGALRLIDRFIKPEQVSLSVSKIIEETNKARLKNDLPTLKENKLLDSSAEKKLKDILDNQYFEHISPSGVGIEKLSEDVGYGYVLIGENLAMGSFKDEKALVDAWMGSFGHRKNILKSEYIEIGVAVTKGVFDGENVWVAVQHFGTPESVCPKVSESLYEVIVFNQDQMKNLDKDLRTRVVKINASRGFGGGYKEEAVEMIEDYNNLVNYYNNLIDQTKTDISNYNNQVKSFNDCISKYQD
jgi:uncharacterized protein YkwD